MEHLGLLLSVLKLISRSCLMQLRIKLGGFFWIVLHICDDVSILCLRSETRSIMCNLCNFNKRNLSIIRVLS